MYRSERAGDRKSLSRDGFYLRIGPFKLNFQLLMDLARNRELFCENEDHSVQLATDILAKIKETRPDAEESSVLDPSMLLNNPSLFLIGPRSQRSIYDVWHHIMRMLKSLRRNVGVRKIIDDAIIGIPESVAAVWLRANEGRVETSALTAAEFCEAMSARLKDTIVQILPRKMSALKGVFTRSSA